MARKEKEIRLRISEEAYERFAKVAKNLDFAPTSLAAIWVMEKLTAVESAQANAQMGSKFLKFMEMMEEQVENPPKE